MIILENDSLEFRFPEVHADARCRIDFQRTLRIPDDGRDYSLPPGLGSFPLRHLDDYAARLPKAYRARGGVIAPMHQAEALWIHFLPRRRHFDLDFDSDFDSGYPFAVKVATGKVCAITGDPWVDHLNQSPQDYAVLPKQPWLDGYCVEKGVIRQFVAMPLGGGYTVEEQLTGAGVHGGLQIVAYPMKAERYEALLRRRYAVVSKRVEMMRAPTIACKSMGLAPGGRMKQKIYNDSYGLDAWDQRHGSRCFVSLVNTAGWMEITGERPPTKPPTAQAYAKGGLPWFDYYGGDAQAVKGSDKLGKLKSVAGHATSTGKGPLPDNETITAAPVVRLGKPRRVREVARV